MSMLSQRCRKAAQRPVRQQAGLFYSGLYLTAAQRRRVHRRATTEGTLDAAMIQCSRSSALRCSQLWVASAAIQKPKR
eukprot:324633-Pleurochrysis_carterae.AAC.2